MADKDSKMDVEKHGDTIEQQITGKKRPGDLDDHIHLTPGKREMDALKNLKDPYQEDLDQEDTEMEIEDPDDDEEKSTTGGKKKASKKKKATKKKKASKKKKTAKKKKATKKKKAAKKKKATKKKKAAKKK